MCRLETHSTTVSGSCADPKKKAPPTRGSTRVSWWDTPHDVTLVDRRLPSPTFRRKEAGLSSELEAPSDLRLDPGPAAEPSGKMLDSQQPFEYGGSRRSDAHPEIVVERH